MEAYMAVLGALAVLFSPALFYLWLLRFVRKEFGTGGDKAARPPAYDRKPDLKQAQSSLRRLIQN